MNMKFNVQMIATMLLFAIVLCSVITVVRSAPTVDQNNPVQLPVDADSAVEPSVRNKRAIIFRPLFVYRQQQIKKQLVDNKVKLAKSNPDKVDFNYYNGQLPFRRQ